MILELNRRVKAFGNPIEAGTFRLHDAQVGKHNAPNPTQLNVLMEKLVEWLRTKEGLLNYDSQSIEKSAEVVVVAALAHYGLVSLLFIHLSL
jgi:Fic family protein